MVAEFNPGKRHRDALHAFARLGRQDAHLAFAGNGPLKSRMEDLAGRLNIKGRTHFLGFREDIPALMQASCAVLLPSQREGLPRSVMEALCLERPCIGSDSRGTRDLLTDDCGILTSVGDVPAMARAMGWMLDHRDEAMAMGRNGRLRMENFDIEIILRMHE
ncbi:glycosyltransferase [Desulfuromonas sp.]